MFRWGLFGGCFFGSDYTSLLLVNQGVKLENQEENRMVLYDVLIETAAGWNKRNRQTVMGIRRRRRQAGSSEPAEKDRLLKQRRQITSSGGV